jgi:cathepsin A (carboxypeptidase C)
MRLSIFLAFILAISVYADEADIMFQLPDCDPFPYNAYSGYLKVTDTKSLHYVFVSSQDDPQTDPLVIWFNGGPGCSSLLAFFQEHGPWVIDDNQTYIHANDWPWNKRANVLYIESPAGVGYSVAGDNDRKFNDMITSQDALTALFSFYTKFPEFRNHDLYVSGESYGGIYVPYLSW